jgi:hypothetical protein
MFGNFFKRNNVLVPGLFTGHFVEPKAFYVAAFNRIPCISFVGELDTTKAFAFIEDRLQMQVKAIYQHNYFNHEEQKMFFNNTIFLLHDNRLIELAHDYCQVLHTNLQYDWANKLVKDLAQFRKAEAPVKENRVIGFARQREMN